MSMSQDVYNSFVLTTPIFSAELTQNPFASTHSLDTNPFDDPVQSSSSLPNDTRDARLEQIGSKRTRLRTK